jgi:calmodulin-regulated spectrin-associated protein
VPENLRDPFYKDHEGQDHLKPQIVVGLGNASLYAQVLTNIYSDPNYQNSNHWSILQVLNRKGCPVKESPKEPLTETILIQTNPLKINAHMSVIESVMNLYAKEVTSSDRVAAAIGRISGGSLPPTVQNYEAALICWISHACAALKKRIDQEVATGGATDDNVSLGSVRNYEKIVIVFHFQGQRLESPDIPPIREIKDLCDGVCLAFLLCYYCPKIVPWSSVRVNYLPTVEVSCQKVNQKTSI